MVAPDPSIMKDPPSYHEIRRVISELREERSAGACGVPTEEIKAVEYCTTRWLRDVLY